jgi:hypothetical protein
MEPQSRTIQPINSVFESIHTSSSGMSRPGLGNATAAAAPPSWRSARYGSLPSCRRRLRVVQLLNLLLVEPPDCANKTTHCLSSNAE